MNSKIPENNTVNVKIDDDDVYDEEDFCDDYDEEIIV